MRDKLKTPCITGNSPHQNYLECIKSNISDNTEQLKFKHMVQFANNSLYGLKHNLYLLMCLDGTEGTVQNKFEMLTTDTIHFND